MAEFVDINSLNDKNVLSGNEKLQVSELEYTTIAHIRDYIENYFINTNAFLRNSNFMYVNTNNSGSNVNGGDVLYFGKTNTSSFVLNLDGSTFADNNSTAIAIFQSNIRTLMVVDSQGGQILYHESAKSFNPTSGSLVVVCIQAICSTDTPNVYGDYIYLVNAAEYSSK